MTAISQQKTADEILSGVYFIIIKWWSASFLFYLFFLSLIWLLLYFCGLYCNKRMKVKNNSLIRNYWYGIIYYFVFFCSLFPHSAVV